MVIRRLFGIRKFGFGPSTTRSPFSLGFVFLFALIAAVTAAAQTQERMQINGGTLSWTATLSQGTCGQRGTGSYSQYEYNNFVFSYGFVSPLTQSTTPVAIPLTGAVGYIFNSTQPPPYCPADGVIGNPSGTAIIEDPTEFYRVLFTPTGSGLGSASMESFSTGSVAPQYIIASVVYAPPGAGTSNKSYVAYAGTTQVGTSDSWSDSFTSSEDVTGTVNLLYVTSSLSTGYTQETDSSSSISIDTTTTNLTGYPGEYPINTVVGLNHDNDIINVWLNPVLNCVAEDVWPAEPSFPAQTECILFDPAMNPNDSLSPLGSPNPQMDIVQLPVAWLNGDATMESQVASKLQSHGITAAEYPTMLAADPYSACNTDVNCVLNIGLSLARFTVPKDAPTIDFEDIGNYQEYSLLVAQTSTAGQAGSNSYQVSEILTSTGDFEKLFDAGLKVQDTMIWTSKWSSTQSQTANQTSTVHIQQPTPSQNYGGPISFTVWQDTVYGTYMFYPVP